MEGLLSTGPTLSSFNIINTNYAFNLFFTNFYWLTILTKKLYQTEHIWCYFVQLWPIFNRFLTKVEQFCLIKHFFRNNVRFHKFWPHLMPHDWCRPNVAMIVPFLPFWLVWPPLSRFKPIKPCWPILCRQRCTIQTLRFPKRYHLWCHTETKHIFLS